MIAPAGTRTTVIGYVSIVANADLYALEADFRACIPVRPDLCDLERARRARETPSVCRALRRTREAVLRLAARYDHRRTLLATVRRRRWWKGPAETPHLDPRRRE